MTPELLATWALFPLRKILATDDGPACTCALGAACGSVGKHPAVLWRYLTAGEKVRGEPGCGYGIATGERSGIFVVDLDGEAAAILFDGLGPCPETFTVRTPREGGGWHLYFKWPGFPVRSSAGALGKKIDVRGDGGFCCAPGSPHKGGGRYEITDDVPLAEAPAWLLDWLRKQKVAHLHEGKSTEPVAIGELDTAYGRWRLATAVRYLQECELSISGSGGRTAMFGVCCTLVRRQRLPVPLAIDAVDMAYNPRLVAAGTAPWSLEEIEERLVSARESGTTPEGWVMDEALWNEMHATRRTGS